MLSRPVTVSLRRDLIGGGMDAATDAGRDEQGTRITQGDGDLRRLDTDLPDVVLIETRVFGDERGLFMETFHERKFADMGIEARWVQDNHSRSCRGVLRGLHYQWPHAQAKLLRVVCGAVFDVAVDIRRRSPTFGRWTGARLSESNHRIMFIPDGFAHGFYVLSEQADIMYKCSDFYDPEGERGILWSDPDLAIDWPLGGRPPILSKKDAANPILADVAPEALPEFGTGEP